MNILMSGLFEAIAICQNSLRTGMSRFRRDESGALFVFSLYIFLPMLIISGMAVDFMRFEARRAALQSTTDRAVLAAASTDRTEITDAQIKAIVIDYFEKAGLSGAIQGAPKIVNTGSYKSVGVDAQIEVDTVFLNMNPGAGSNFKTIEHLYANASATAVEGVADIEISLVLNIGSTMGTPTTTLDEFGVPLTRMDLMKDAAKTFVSIVLNPDYKDSISLSLVPYSEQVNIGADLFSQIKANQEHPYSYCVEFVAADFNETGITITRNYEQTQHFQLYPYGYSTGVEDLSNPGLDAPVCPIEDDERVLAISQDVTELNRRIDTFIPRAGTSTHVGLKWGVALLDPAVQPIVADMSAGGIVDAAFSNRPRDFPVAGVASEVQKIVVLMTDGSNSDSYRLTDYSYNQQNYDLKRAYWDMYNYPYAYNVHQGNGDPNRFHRKNSDPNYDPASGDYDYQGFWTNDPGYYLKYSTADADLEMLTLCDLAKEKRIVIFAIAVDADANGQTAMADCASTDSHYFSATSTEMPAVFKTIAEQITELRLSL